MDGLWNGAPKFEGAEAREMWIPVEEKASIRVIVFEPDEVPKDSDGTVVMVPGWGSLFVGWRPLVEKWGKKQASDIHRNQRKGQFHNQQEDIQGRLFHRKALDGHRCCPRFS